MIGQGESLNFVQTVSLQNTPHASPLWASYGMLFVGVFGENIPRDIESGLCVELIGFWLPGQRILPVKAFLELTQFLVY